MRIEKVIIKLEKYITVRVLNVIEGHSQQAVGGSKLMWEFTTGEK